MSPTKTGSSTKAAMGSETAIVSKTWMESRAAMVLTTAWDSENMSYSGAMKKF